MPNTAAAVKSFFDTPEKPLGTSEFMDFWKSLSDEEKEYYKNADLS